MRRGGRRRCMAVAVGVSLLVASCTGGAHPTNPYAVPSKITPAYVQRVLNALEGVNARATRLIVENHRLVPEAIKVLRSTSTIPEYNLQTRIWSAQLSSGLSNYRPDPGPVIDHLVSLIYGTKSCLFASLKRDYSKVQKVPQSSPLTYISLLRQAARLNSPNPTPWRISFFGYTVSGQAPQDPCLR
jgi:hypothetical protein